MQEKLSIEDQFVYDRVKRDNPELAELFKDSILNCQKLQSELQHNAHDEDLVRRASGAKASLAKLRKQITGF